MAFHSPIEQFEIHNWSAPLFSIGGHDIAFSSASFYMLMAIVVCGLFLASALRREAVVPGRLQMAAEMIYNLVANTLSEAAGPKAKPYLPFIFSIFMFIFTLNIFGMFPNVLTVTAQIVFNFALALIVMFTVLGVGFYRHGVKFVGVFTPHGVPGAIAPFITLIEFVSFWMRPCSLSLRLFGNMLAGHILLKVFAGMTAVVATTGAAAASGVFPLLINLVIIAFEFFVAGLQAYVFTVLSSVYLRDAIEMH
jgi:F-type H+-transporting ATPase subunit a